MLTLPIKPGKYRTRNGKEAIITDDWGTTYYVRGYVKLKTTTQTRTWNSNDGSKVCYSNHGKNPQDLVEGPLAE